MEQKSSQFLRKRKMLLMLPFITIPFLTLAFWALGGGKANNQAISSEMHKGLNMELPSAVFGKQKDLDKLGYYQKADSDSDKIKAMIRNDPFYNKGLSNDQDLSNSETTDVLHEELTNEIKTNKLPIASTRNKSSFEKNETELIEKLTQLEKALNEPDTALQSEQNSYNTSKSIQLQNDSNDQESQLGEIAQTIHGEDPNETSQIDQLNGMLDKILEIQHPNRLREEQNGNSLKNSTRVFVASAIKGHPYYSILDSSNAGRDKGKENAVSNGFYSTEDNINISADQNAIAAQVYSTQTLVSGGTIKLRLLTDVHIDGKLISKNQFVYGVASLSGERLLIDIKTIRSARSIYAVKLKVYDMDGMEGIYVPGAITTDALKQSADQTIQSLGINSISNSLSVQAASAGIEALKNMVSKKVKLTKVTVKAGYNVFLMNATM